MIGWGNCGTDSEGRPIGYVFPATCDHQGCTKEIDRGLSYACGNMHGFCEYGCEKYFCGDHLGIATGPSTDETFQLCEQCLDELIIDDDLMIHGHKDDEPDNQE